MLDTNVNHDSRLLKLWQLGFNSRAALLLPLRPAWLLPHAPTSAREATRGPYCTWFDRVMQVFPIQLTKVVPGFDILIHQSLLGSMLPKLLCADLNPPLASALLGMRVK